MEIDKLTDLGWSNHFETQLPLDSRESQLPFRVISVQRNLVECVGLDIRGHPANVQLSTYFWRREPPESHPAIGDWVLLDPDYQVIAILERKTLLKRRGAGKESTIQLIAANIDMIFIVTSCNDEFSINRIERYLAIAAESGIHCVLVLSKIDLCVDTSPYTDRLALAHPTLPVETVNATDPVSLVALQRWTSHGQTVALLGSSGVGKSTIINMLAGKSRQTTAAIREKDAKGRHTTSSRSLHRLAGGGLLIDTPGMRELQIVDSGEGIKTTFSDIDTLARACRFKNCEHTDEPGCAVLAEIREGRIEQRRLDNYHKLMSEQKLNTESLAERRKSDRALGRFYKHALKSSRKFKSRE